MADPALPALPVRSRTRVEWLCDSTRWDNFCPRPTDVVVATYAKCGTTWMETIVLNLLHSGSEVPRLYDVAPWIDLRFPRGDMGTDLLVEELLAWVESLPDPRQFKTHLSLECLPFYPQVKYLIVARDMREACFSWHDHRAKWAGEEDLREFWLDWVNNGERAPDAQEGKPHPHFDFYQGWWQYQHLDNILLVHYNDLHQDLKGEILRVAEFLKIEVDDGALHAVAKAATFSTMKENAEQLLGKHTHLVNKGTRRRWKDILTDEDLVLYDKAKVEAMRQGVSAECLEWLEMGWLKKG